eukprot:3714582-Karenia_brevis.AAC.1
MKSRRGLLGLSKCLRALRKEKAKGAQNQKARVSIGLRIQHQNASERRDLRMTTMILGAVGKDGA